MSIQERKCTRNIQKCVADGNRYRKVIRFKHSHCSYRHWQYWILSPFTFCYRYSKFSISVILRCICITLHLYTALFKTDVTLCVKFYLIQFGFVVVAAKCLGSHFFLDILYSYVSVCSAQVTWRKCCLLFILPPLYSLCASSSTKPLITSFPGFNSSSVKNLSITRKPCNT